MHLKTQIKEVAAKFVRHVGSDDPEYINFIEKNLVQDITALVEIGQFNKLPSQEQGRTKETEILDI